ncbi:hypothetical protein TNCV_1990511 [Trichonephila clavipes]|nr:hypothetical protein TNCV_1990511 [Trichonephila clavipes]
MLQQFGLLGSRSFFLLPKETVFESASNRHFCSNEMLTCNISHYLLWDHVDDLFLRPTSNMSCSNRFHSLPMTLVYTLYTPAIVACSAPYNSSLLQVFSSRVDVLSQLFRRRKCFIA